MKCDKCKREFEEICKYKIDYNILNKIYMKIRYNKISYTNTNLTKIYADFRFNQNSNIIQVFQDDLSEDDDNYIKMIPDRMVVGEVLNELISERKYQYRGCYVFFQMRHIQKIHK